MYWWLRPDSQSTLRGFHFADSTRLIAHVFPKKVWDMSTLSMSSSPPVHILRTPHPIKKVQWRPPSVPSSTSPSHVPHLTELFVIPRTIGISPFGDPSSKAKEKEYASLEHHTRSHHNIGHDFEATRTNALPRHFLHLKETDAEENADVDKDRPCIWDVRRHHVPKYVLLGGEGATAGKIAFASHGDNALSEFDGVVDAVWTSSDTMCAVYKNGSFIRHDVAHSYTPIFDPTVPDPYPSSPLYDQTPTPGTATISEPFKKSINRMGNTPAASFKGGSISRHALSWDPMGGIAFAVGKKSLGEIPFDDMYVAPVLPEIWMLMPVAFSIPQKSSNRVDARHTSQNPVGTSLRISSDIRPCTWSYWRDWRRKHPSWSHRQRVR